LLHWRYNVKTGINRETTAVAKQPPSSVLRKELREKILDRIEHLQLTQADAANQLGISPAQMSRLAGRQDIFSLDRLVDLATGIGLTVRMSATRLYQSG
jgi:predicted XRE-type DNA-binding protein